MVNTRFCILCGEPFESDDPDAVFCPVHGGTPQALADQRDVPSPMDFSTDWKAGDPILDTYQVKGKLGEGGFGAVYRVHHMGWNMDLAVKRALNLDEQGKYAFIQEAEKWIDLGLHPHIISCYYVRNIDGFPHTFAELAEGGSLHEWIRAEGTHDLYSGEEGEILARIIDLAIQFAWGLEYAHQQGLVHGDVKPQNALMTLEGILKVTDFGLAKAGKDSADIDTGGLEYESKPKKIVLSPKHCSPEQFAGQKLTLKTDIWSWGVSVLEMFNGGITWAAGQVAAFALESYLGRVGDEEDIPAMPGAIADLLRYCFRDDPLSRPKDMSEIADRLIEVYQQETGHDYFRMEPKAAELRADSLNNKALTMLDLGREKEAVKCWKAALEADSFHLQTTFNYGVWRWRNALITDEALLEQLNRVGSLKPDQEDYLYLSSLVQLERGDHVRFRKILNKAGQKLQTEIQKTGLISNVDEEKSTRCIVKLDTGNVSSMAVSMDGNTLITACQATQLAAWDLNNNKCKMRSQGFIEAELPVVAVSSNGRWIVEGGYQMLRVWDSMSGTAKPFDIFDSSPRSLAVSPDDKLLVCGFDTGTVILYNLKSREFLDELPYHRADVRTVIFSQDGQLVLSGGDYGEVIAWSVSSRSTLIEFSGPDVWSLTVSSQGEQVFAACRDGNIYHWDLRQKELVRKFSGHREEVTAIALSLDGKLLISGSDDATVRVWDPRTGRCLYTAHEQEGSVRGVWLHNKSPIGYRAVIASDVDGARIWNIASENSSICRLTLSRPSDVKDMISQADLVVDSKDQIRKMLINGDYAQARDLLVAARKILGYENDNELIDLSYEVGEHIGSYESFLGARKLEPIKDQGNRTDSLSVTSNGRYLLTDDSEIKIWNLQTKLQLCTIPGRPYVLFPPKPFVLSPDDRFLAMHMDVGIYQVGTKVGLWDLEVGQWSQILNHEDNVTDFQFCSEGGQLIALQKNGDNNPCQLIVWDVQSGKEQSRIPCGNNAYRILASKNGRFVIAAEEFDGNNCNIAIVSLDEGQPSQLLSGFGYPIILSPDSYHAVAFNGTTFVLLDLITGKDTRIEGLTEGISRITLFGFTQNGRNFVGPYHQKVGVWSVRTGELINLLETPGWQFGITCLQMGYQDIWVFAAGGGNAFSSEIALWNINSSQPVHIFKGFGEVFSIALWHQDRYMIARSAEQYCVWQLDWEQEFPEQNDWDKRAIGYLEVFLGQNGGAESWLTLCKKDPADAQVRFSKLMEVLGPRGYGWLREEGVRKKLEEMAAERG